MASPTQQVEKARQAVRAFMSGLVGMDEAKECLIDLGAASGFLDFLDAPGEYDISSADVIAALGPTGALTAINAALDANSGEHRKALRKLL